MSKAPSPEGVEQPPASLLERLRAEPDRAPEIVALAAGERFAGPARRFADRLRALGHPPDEIARQAVRRHARMARAEGAVVGAGGALTVVPDLVALAWLQS
ncbi:MAG: EcsC family protein, partial [Actinobacteria bacterium]|nr:EcsC family protein [Actinomycetota bacterium]